MQEPSQQGTDHYLYSTTQHSTSRIVRSQRLKQKISEMAGIVTKTARTRAIWPLLAVLATAGAGPATAGAGPPLQTPFNAPSTNSSATAPVSPAVCEPTACMILDVGAGYNRGPKKTDLKHCRRDDNCCAPVLSWAPLQQRPAPLLSRATSGVGAPRRHETSSNSAGNRRAPEPPRVLRGGESARTSRRACRRRRGRGLGDRRGGGPRGQGRSAVLAGLLAGTRRFL